MATLSQYGIATIQHYISYQDIAHLKQHPLPDIVGTPSGPPVADQDTSLPVVLERGCPGTPGMPCCWSNPLWLSYHTRYHRQLSRQRLPRQVVCVCKSPHHENGLWRIRLIHRPNLKIQKLVQKANYRFWRGYGLSMVGIRAVNNQPDVIKSWDSNCVSVYI